MKRSLGMGARGWVTALCVGLALGACGGSGDDAASDAGTGGGVGGAGGSGGEGGAGGGAGGEGGAGGALLDVPYDGPLPALPAGSVVDDRTYFPIPGGGVWRYRKRSTTPQSPEPVTQGGESDLVVRPDPTDATRNEVVRATVTIFDLPASGDREAQKVRQVLKETYLVTPAEGQVGPKVQFSKLDIEEREVGTGKFVRTLRRTYDPAYTLMDDAWRVGVIRSQNSEQCQVEEVVQEHGEAEPRENSYLAEVRVEAADREETLMMEARYREHVRQVDVYDDVTQQPTRTLWVQPGVGIVQWVYRDATNLTFTLVETNVETAAAE